MATAVGATAVGATAVQETAVQETPWRVLRGLDDPAECPVRDVLDRIGDAWSVLTLVILEDQGTLRFNALRREIDARCAALDGDGRPTADWPMPVTQTCFSG